MDIRTYLSRAPRGASARLARAIGVHPVMVSQWAEGVKRVAIGRCAAIEKATGGQVRRWDLRPLDWWEQWPELIGAEGAPEVPTEQVA